MRQADEPDELHDWKNSSNVRQLCGGNPQQLGIKICALHQYELMV
jgi:hypothetical protein